MRQSLLDSGDSLKGKIPGQKSAVTVKNRLRFGSSACAIGISLCDTEPTEEPTRTKENRF